jgi:hypothetical protein
MSENQNEKEMSLEDFQKIIYTETISGAVVKLFAKVAPFNAVCVTNHIGMETIIAFANNKIYFLMNGEIKVDYEDGKILQIDESIFNDLEKSGENL